MKQVVKAIDFVNEWTGKVVSWLVVATLLIAVAEVAQRYLLGSPTMWGPEIMVMLGAAMYALSWGYVHRHEGHIRVDVFYTYLRPRGKATLNVVCALLFFFPLVATLVYVSGSWMWTAWEVGERSAMTFWHPPIAPLRTAVFLGLLLLIIQGVARFIRDLYFLVKKKTL